MGWQAREQLLRLQADGDLDLAVLPFTGRVIATLAFHLRRPASAPRRVRYPLRKPDVDNLAKSVLDALVNVAVLNDDNIVTDLTISKRFAPPDAPEGVEITLLSWLPETHVASPGLSGRISTPSS